MDLIDRGILSGVQDKRKNRFQEEYEPMPSTKYV